MKGGRAVAGIHSRRDYRIPVRVCSQSIGDSHSTLVSQTGERELRSRQEDLRLRWCGGSGWSRRRRSPGELSSSCNVWARFNHG
jgi:hypothetical protein